MSKKKGTAKTEITDMVDEIVEDSSVEESVEPTKPSSSDPRWVDYVIDQLKDSELFNGAPTTDGLRRVCEKHYGEIILSASTPVDVLCTNTGRCAVNHTLNILKYETGSEIMVSACVDVLHSKLPAPFNEHMLATACTRAEGKALRRAMKIKVHTSEELNNEDPEDASSGEPVNDQQVSAIKVMSKRNNVDLEGFCKSQSDGAGSIKDLTNLEARLIINKLSSFQRKGVPEEYSGYDAGWEESFGV